MARIKVLRPFVDIHTKNRHDVDEIFEATPDRVAEIQSVDPDLIQVLPDEEVVNVPKRSRKKVGEV